MSREIVAATIVWGAKYIAEFLDIALPSALAPGNLPAVRGLAPTRYEIVTRPTEFALFDAAPGIRALRELMPVTLTAIDPDIDLSAGTHAQYLAVRRLAQRLAAERAAMLYLMPDCLWSDGSLGRTAKALSEGAHAVLQPTVRVVAESAVPDLSRYADGGVIKIPPADTVRMAQEHIHPLVACYERDSERFPHHAELVLWPARSGGFSMLYTIRDPKCFVPHLVELSHQLLLTENNDFSRVEAITDPLHVLGLSLTPLMQDIDWIADAQRYDHMRAGVWFSAFHAAFNETCLSQPLHFGVAAPERTAVEPAIRAFAARLRMDREAAAYASMMVECGAGWAAHLVLAALDSGRLTRKLSPQGPFRVFAPASRVFESGRIGEVERLLAPANRRQLLATMRDHVVVDDPKCGLRSLNGDPVVRETVRGRSAYNGRLVVGGVERAGRSVVMLEDWLVEPS